MKNLGFLPFVQITSPGQNSPVFEDEEDFISWAKEHLPTASCKASLDSDSVSLSVCSYSKASHRLEIFLLDLVRIWFLTDLTQLRSFESTPFVLDKHPDQSFLFVKFQLVIKRKNDVEKIQKTIPLLLQLIELFHKWPEDFSHFMQDYQHFLSLAEEEFQAHRSLRHQLRLLFHLHLMRKKLLHKYPLAPSEPHVEMRLLPTYLKYPFSQKFVIGVAVAISLPNPYDRLEDRHILLAVQKLLPWSWAIRESFLVFQKPHSSIRLLYLEIEKNNGSHLSFAERALLQQQLQLELNHCVETLYPSIFGNCDVEEVMRNIRSLGHELKTEEDCPQVMISFEGVSVATLIFRVIVIRLLSDQSKPLFAYFQALNDSSFEYVSERSSQIGHIGKRAKEATVLRLHLSKASFLFRSDSSLNLYRARQRVHSLVVRALGEIRDFNGGIFSKQLEHYFEFQKLFQQHDPELLEDFFHALHPPEMQVILPIPSIATLFDLLLQVLAVEAPKEENYLLRFQEKETFQFTILRLKDGSFQERLTRALTEAELFKDIKAWCVLSRYDGLILGYITQFSPEQKYGFNEVLNRTLQAWSLERKRLHVFRLDIQDFPVSLDPRLGGDDISGILLKLLFEGLMRRDSRGNITCAIASDVKISADGKRYTFLLRKCCWNNGDLITAHDFCYAWKKVLSPDFSTPFSYLFYAIKNAELAKKGLISSDEIGVFAPDDLTIIVDLEYPCSYFLELTANPLYSPVNHRLDLLHPNWSLQTGQDYVCNGPFYLETTNSREIYILQKNLKYWDASTVQLNRIQISKATAHKAWEMFEKGEIDWLGRPSRPWAPFFSNSSQRSVEKLSPSAVFWCSCNVQQFPLQSSKLRLALAYAIDRQAIANKLPHIRVPAFTPLPFVHAEQQDSLAWSSERAVSLFEEALQELGLTRKTWPSLKLIHANNEVRKEIATDIVCQWKEVLGIQIHTEALEFRDLFHQMTQGHYQLGLIIWRALVDDPLYTLNSLKSARDEINFPKWESTHYQELIERAWLETDREKRHHQLAEAEAFLIREMPIIPLVHEVELYMKAPGVEGEIVSKTGNFDFKYVKTKNYFNWTLAI